MTAVKDREENVIVEEELLNVENEREERSEDAVSGPIMEITIEEMNKAMKCLRSNKTGGP